MNRYRYKGQFVSDRDAARLLNLRHASKYVTVSEVKPTHYRYKGQFVSQEKAERLSHLPEARKFVSIEKAGKPSIAAQVERAIKADRKAREAEFERRRALKEETKRQRQADEKKRETFNVFDVAKQAARRAEAEDISIEEALDEGGYDEGDFDYYSYEDVAGYTSDFMEYGDEYDFFAMEDLDVEDLYPGE
jgi:hypothetical protein